MRKKLSHIATAALLTVASMVLAVPTSYAATYISGTAQCVSGNNVVGVWIEATNGGSGWAYWTPTPGLPSEATYSYTLPNDGNYDVTVGCGGTPQNWATSNVSPLLSGTSYSFLCYDLAIYGQYYLTCQP